MTKIIDKPWGREEIWAHTDQYAGKIIVIEPHSKLSLQYHEEKIETIRVLSGTLYLHYQLAGTELKVIQLLPSESKHIGSGTIHRFEAKDSQVILIEVSTTELDDVVRIEDDYGRCNE